MTTRSATDRSVGLGIVFSVVAVAAAVATGVFGFQNAMAHGAGGVDAQLLSGIAFGVAVLGGAAGIIAIHVYAR